MAAKKRAAQASAVADVDYVLTVRARDEAGAFHPEVGKPSYLIIDGDKNIEDGTPLDDPDDWCQRVIADGSWKNGDEQRGDILFFVHGYNVDEGEILERHRRIKRDLRSFGYRGTVVSFDWPSDNKALAYWEDRHRAVATALALVDAGIKLLSAKQTPTCPVNIHVIAHSTGAYVVREAFCDADNTALPNQSWLVSQLVFIAGDVSADSMTASDPGFASVYRHCVRLTNYSNRYDLALDISNVKRVGIAPRVGRIGLPDGIPQKAVNVDCSDYYQSLASSKAMQKTDQPYQPPFLGFQSHTWFFGNRVFTQDLFHVIIGTDRFVSPLRALIGSQLVLQNGSAPDTHH